MVDVRTLAAAVLGVAVGILFVATPETIIQIQTAGRLPQDRHGRYGEDGTRGGSGESDEEQPNGAQSGPLQWRRLVQVVGVALVAGGLYFGWTLV